MITEVAFSGGQHVGVRRKPWRMGVAALLSTTLDRVTKRSFPAEVLQHAFAFTHEDEIRGAKPPPSRLNFRQRESKKAGNSEVFTLAETKRCRRGQSGDRREGGAFSEEGL